MRFIFVLVFNWPKGRWFPEIKVGKYNDNAWASVDDESYAAMCQYLAKEAIRLKRERDQEVTEELLLASGES